MGSRAVHTMRMRATSASLDLRSLTTDAAYLRAQQHTTKSHSYAMHFHSVNSPHSTFNYQHIHVDGTNKPVV